jgi:hypothetical protein
VSDTSSTWCDASAVRWEGDETGHGIADGSAFAPGVRELLDEMARPGWVTEEPHVHLLPHLRAACEPPDAAFSVDSAELDGSVFVVTLRRRHGGSLGALRRDLYSLVGEVSEPATAIVQRETDGGVEFDVTTGMMTDATPFDTGHGHLVRFVVPMR